MLNRIPKSETTACSLTVYNDGFALVKDTRSIPQLEMIGLFVEKVEARFDHR